MCGSYFEPFAGALSLLWSIKPSPATISDLNPHLMDFYQEVKQDPDQLHSTLIELGAHHSSSAYYEAREEFNNGATTARKAGLFIYLNRAGFNGVYRVNRGGHYNVPYGGNTKRLLLPSLNHLQKLSLLLSSVKILNTDFECAVSEAVEGDFVYFDPPYTSEEGLGYDKYTQRRFDFDEQRRLMKVANALGEGGVRVMISHVDDSSIDTLYKDWNRYRYSVRRSVNPSRPSYQGDELVITNY